MAEQESEPIGPAYMQRQEDPSGLVYKTTETPSALTATAEPDDPWKDWNAWMKGHLAIERQAIREELEGALVEIIVELRKEWREEVREAITKHDARIAHLEGQVEVLTRLYAGKSADVIDLPSNWKPKDVA